MTALKPSMGVPNGSPWNGVRSGIELLEPSATSWKYVDALWFFPTSYSALLIEPIRPPAI